MVQLLSEFGYPDLSTPSVSRRLRRNEAAQLIKPPAPRGVPDLALNGAKAATTIDDGTNRANVFTVGVGISLTLSNLTIKNGLGSGGEVSTIPVHYRQQNQFLC